MTVVATPIVAHVIYRLDVGGLESGLVNFINTVGHDPWRHVIICQTEASDFRLRLQRPVEIIELHKQPGQDPGMHWRLFKVLRRLRPAIVHTYNIGALECQLTAYLAGVPGRVHAEHGWDSMDPFGQQRRYRWLRRASRPLVHRYIPVSRHIQTYLEETVGLPGRAIQRITNGVDTQRFQPCPDARLPMEGLPTGAVVIGCVGRMQPIKDPLNLVRAFIELIRREPTRRAWLRLAMIGDGPLWETAKKTLETAGLGALCWLPGSREDVAALLPAMDIFVLPSLNEGISYTILEAMACALPTVVTDVGGNSELVLSGETGALVPADDAQALASALEPYLEDSQRRQGHGQAARQRVCQYFSLERMAAAYLRVYQSLPGPSSGGDGKPHEESL